VGQAAAHYRMVFSQQYLFRDNLDACVKSA